MRNISMRKPEFEGCVQEISFKTSEFLNQKEPTKL